MCRKFCWAQQWWDESVKTCASSLNWTGFLSLSQDCFGQFAALVFDNPYEKNTALSSLISHSKHRLKNTAMKADQFVPICSMEMNSSPVFPGYWPSQWRPPANPYTENEGGGRGLKWEGGERQRELGQIQQLVVKSGHRWGGRPDVLQGSGRELGEGPEWEERYEWYWYRCLQLGFKPESWSSGGVSEPPSELALKQRLW